MLPDEISAETATTADVTSKRGRAKAAGQADAAAGATATGSSTGSEVRPDPPRAIEVRGARVHNLRDIEVDVPLGHFVGIAGVSGSGKSSLAMGVLYAEGARRYLEALSTYTRRRLTGPGRAEVDQVRHIPSAVALRQRPPVPGVRSTVGTLSEVLNVIRLAISRLGEHRCPNGHMVPPSLEVAASGQLTCPTCGAVFEAPGAESFAFNSAGACPTCGGTGEIRALDPATLIPDPTKTIDEHAVASWMFFGKQFMPQVVAQLGVRTDVPFEDLTDQERDIVLHGPEVKRRLVVGSRNGGAFDLNVTYENAFQAVEKALAKAKSEKGAARLDKFYHLTVCPACGGSRFSEQARSSLLAGYNIAQLSQRTLTQLRQFALSLPTVTPDSVAPLAQRLGGEWADAIRPLEELGLGYLGLDRAGSTLSAGELQRIHLARTLRGETTGVLYVLDEPSIGLHPANVHGLIGVIRGLVADGNSAVVVDHSEQVLQAADYLIEIGPDAGEHGGQVINQGSVADVIASPTTVIGGFLAGTEQAVPRTPRPEFSQPETYPRGALELSVAELHTVHDVRAVFPIGGLIGLTGVSGSGKTTLVIESLVPAVQARLNHQPLPSHIRSLEFQPTTRSKSAKAQADSSSTSLSTGSEAESAAKLPIRRVISVDSAPIGKNSRSTLATYSGVFDQIRGLFASLPEAKSLSAGFFSYNTEGSWCPVCRGIGEVSLDVQFLPDVRITCPECGGHRYAKPVLAYQYHGRNIADVLQLTCEQAVDFFADEAGIVAKLALLSQVGLGYLTLGESTPQLSGGEAQRLRLVSELHRSQHSSLFVFDEPTVGLHPRDVGVLVGVFDRLIDAGATVVVVEHDLDLIAACDYLMDMGPGSGEAGGQIVAAGSPAQVAAVPQSLTGQWLAGTAG
ncbi:MAG: excinuclease ABC subunit UvrA [Propionibacteriaceae bacterium]|nr:excinuclease ABC subunit UvrA [Propionibacteriaceae bacterium]